MASELIIRSGNFTTVGEGRYLSGGRQTYLSCGEARYQEFFRCISLSDLSRRVFCPAARLRPRPAGEFWLTLFCRKRKNSDIKAEN